jgi:hypothetical protein
MNEFIILLRPYPNVQDLLILNSRIAGMLNNPNEVLNVCASPCVSVANKCFVFLPAVLVAGSFFSAFVMFFCLSAN